MATKIMLMMTSGQLGQLSEDNNFLEGKYKF